MHKFIFSFLLILLLTGVHAQKMFVWCPADIISSIPPQLGILKGQKVTVQIKDARTFGSKVENKCSSEEIVNSLFSILKAAFPNAALTKVTVGQLVSEKKEVFLDIEITAYQAYFTTAIWHATTAYTIKIIDNRNVEKNELSKTIEKDRSFFNALGTITAKSNLKKSYQEASIELLDFISSTLKN